MLVLTNKLFQKNPLFAPHPKTDTRPAFKIWLPFCKSTVIEKLKILSKKCKATIIEKIKSLPKKKKKKRLGCLFKILFYFILFLSFWHAEVPEPGIKPEPQQ